jgi:hypothetical protein
MREAQLTAQVQGLSIAASPGATAWVIYTRCRDGRSNFKIRSSNGKSKIPSLRLKRRLYISEGSGVDV